MQCKAEQRLRRHVCSFGGASRGLNIQDPIILLSRRLSYQDLHDPNRQWITVRKAKGNTQCAFQVKFVRKYGICSGYFSKWEMVNGLHLHT